MLVQLVDVLPLLQEALHLLAQVTPQAVGMTEATTSSTSETSARLGLRVIRQGEPVLLESRLVSSSLESVSGLLSGSEKDRPAQRISLSADSAPASSLPSLQGIVSSLPQGVDPRPNALGRAVYLQPPRQPYPATAKIHLSALPSSHATLRETDKRLVNAGQIPTSVAVTDATVKHLEEASRRSLLSVSVMDRFLAGLVSHIRDPASPDGEFNLREEIDTSAVASMASQCCAALQDIANQAATTYGNAILLRRDMVLSSPALSVSNETAIRSLRAVPLGNAGLFGTGETEASLSAEETRRARDKLMGGSGATQSFHKARGGKKNRKGKGKPDRFQRAKPKPSGAGGQGSSRKRPAGPPKLKPEPSAKKAKAGQSN